MSNVVLVPTDFTSVGDCAVNHGGVLAKSTNRKLVVLHVVNKADKVADAKTKVSAIATKAASQYGVEAEGVVRIGNIFDDISETATELGAKMIVMGTHGAKGMQRFTGSYAMKVITSSEVPFIIVQEKHAESDGYADIVFPVDLEKESKQKVKYVADIANHFNSRVHLVFEQIDDTDLKKYLAANLIFAKKYLTERNVSFNTKALEGSDFEDAIVKYAVSNGCDLIAIMNMDDGFLSNLFGESSEQELITNEAQIPVLIANPKITSTMDSFTVTGGA